MSRYKQFDVVALPNGASVTLLDPWENADPPAWIVEVYNAPGSMGDGVTDMQEGPDGLIALNPVELAEILRQPPNLYVPAKA